MESQVEKIIYDVAKDLFQRVGFALDDLEVEKTTGSEEQEIFIAKLSSNDNCASFLDNRGNNLKAFEHLVRILVSKEAGQKANIVLDLNGFREKRNGKISELARLVAEKVQASQKAYVLRPMSAYERRLVHLELAGWSNITTESIGEEPRRRVVIKPHP